MLETMVCNVWVTGCSTVRSVSWFNTVDKQLTSPVPVHTNHDVEQAFSAVYQQKEELKRKAVETDLPTKRLAADAVSGISFEARGKINYHMSSLARMARRTRQAADILQHQRPGAPLYPGDYVLSHNNKCIILWDFGYHKTTTSPQVDKI